METTQAQPDLQDPIWTIEHIATCFHVTVDTAREYTYRADFPQPRDLGSRLLWPGAEILAWFTGLRVKTSGQRCRKGQAPSAPRVISPSTRKSVYRPRAPHKATS